MRGHGVQKWISYPTAFELLYSIAVSEGHIRLYLEDSLEKTGEAKTLRTKKNGTYDKVLGYINKKRREEQGEIMNELYNTKENNWSNKSNEYDGEYVLENPCNCSFGCDCERIFKRKGKNEIYEKSKENSENYEGNNIRNSKIERFPEEIFRKIFEYIVEIKYMMFYVDKLNVLKEIFKLMKINKYWNTKIKSILGNDKQFYKEQKDFSIKCYVMNKVMEKVNYYLYGNIKRFQITIMGTKGYIITEGKDFQKIEDCLPALYFFFLLKIS
ncbi:hypothetical protein C1646_764437 [Rhizophagus diaphanus]|nr:hypothetical protein C1646_764437 [Rhizophagus diaphanus] [Rhizophagus sp. MUCL 43196]